MNKGEENESCSVGAMCTNTTWSVASCNHPSANVFALADLFYFGGVQSSMRFGGITFFSLTLEDHMGLVHLHKYISFNEHWWGVTLEGS